ncbi:hypothetical protein Ae201684_013734 [Aphanomyces euteiches]|uniref:Uncharacterized protein n=1 Tax=Aphanomyces euteiches TaxID=100861 RepID=A0A6G0WM41_9STRA|nr:hypothetical protein Ae201684_013734 [Aphanomyces euteiches]
MIWVIHFTVASRPKGCRTFDINECEIRTTCTAHIPIMKWATRFTVECGLVELRGSRYYLGSPGASYNK